MIGRLRLIDLPAQTSAFIRIRGQSLLRNAYIRTISIQDMQTLTKSRREVARDKSGQDEESPTIFIVIATYNRANILIERTLPSVLTQTYENIRVVIVGDHCTDETEALIQRMNSPKIDFVNLTKRGSYPSNPEHRRLIAGIDPINKSHDLAYGSWIAHIDDDDIWEPDHLETLMKTAQDGNYEFVSSILLREFSPGQWGEIYSGHSTFLYSPILKDFRYVRSSWRVGLGGDAAMLHRLRFSGVRMGFVKRITAYAPLRPGTTRFDHLAEDRT